MEVIFKFQHVLILHGVGREMRKKCLVDGFSNIASSVYLSHVKDAVEMVTKRLQ